MKWYNQKKRNAKKEEVLVLAGKDCCKEFIIGFLATITLMEVNEEIAKGGEMDDAMIGKLIIKFTRQYCTSFTSI